MAGIQWALKASPCLTPNTLKSKFAGKSRYEIISFFTRPRQVEVYQTLLVRNLPHRPISLIRSGLVGLGVDPKKVRDLKFLGPSLHVLEDHVQTFCTAVNALNATAFNLTSIEQICPADLYR